MDTFKVMVAFMGKGMDTDTAWKGYETGDFEPRRCRLRYPMLASKTCTFDRHDFFAFCNGLSDLLQLPREHYGKLIRLAFRHSA